MLNKLGLDVISCRASRNQEGRFLKAYIQMNEPEKADETEQTEE